MLNGNNGRVACQNVDKMNLDDVTFFYKKHNGGDFVTSKTFFL